MRVIELSDEQAEALKAKAASEGLSLEAWLTKPAVAERPTETPMQTAAEIVVSCMSKVPAELMAAMPRDASSQHDHYIYGWPKKEE